MVDKTQFDRGTARMKDLFGDTFKGQEFGQDDFRDITVGALFGDVWTRPGLELRDRSLITCATLVALGKEPQLKIHLRGLLNVGLSREGVEEMMIHLAHYSGWPTAVNGMRVARELFAEMDAAE
jgi:4-carboxymuconolactone decarboxylase